MNHRYYRNTISVNKLAIFVSLGISSIGFRRGGRREGKGRRGAREGKEEEKGIGRRGREGRRFKG